MLKTRFSSPLQTTGWAKVKEQNGSIVAWTDEKPAQWMSIKSAPGVGKFGYVPHFMVESHLLRSTEQQLEQMARDHGLGFILIDPFMADQPYQAQAPVSTPSGLDTIQLQQHMLIDLQQDADTIMSGMRSSHRRYLRKLINNEQTTVECGTSPEFAERFIATMKAATSADNYGHYPDKYYRDILASESDDFSSYVTMVTLDGEDVGTNLIISNGRVAAELFIGLTARGRKDSAGILLSWGAMQQSQSNGDQRFLQWGVAPMDAEGNFDKSHTLYGISEFKRRFGGECLRLADQRVIILSNWRWRLFQTLSRLRR